MSIQLSSASWEARRAVAEEPSTPLETLVELSQDEHPNIRAAVAENSSTPVDVLSKLAEDESANVRYCVASNPDTSIKILERLSTDPNEEIRGAVSKNRNSSLQTLTALNSANKESNEYSAYAVLWNLANNPSSPRGILEELARHKTKEIRLSVATNSRTSRKTLAILAEDPNHEVREAALSNPTLTAYDRMDILANKYLAALEIHGITPEAGMEAVRRNRDSFRTNL